MHIKLIQIFSLFLIASSPCLGEEKRILTRQEAVKMLPYSIEGNAPGEYETFLKLTDFGELAYPALVEELLDPQGSSRVASIVGVFVSSKGNKTLPLRAMVRFVEMHGRDVPTFPGLQAVIRGIGQLGGENEKGFLRQYLDVEDGLVRHVVEDSMALIEKRQEAMKREATSRERRELRNANATDAGKTESATVSEKYGGGINTNSNKAGLLAVVLCVVVVILVFIRKLYHKRIG